MSEDAAERKSQSGFFPTASAGAIRGLGRSRHILTILGANCALLFLSRTYFTEKLFLIKRLHQNISVLLIID